MFLDLLREELGAEKLAGAHTRFCCPFCGENKYKFYVHNTKSLWICQKCRVRGNALSFTKKYYNAQYAEAVDILATYDHDVNIDGGGGYDDSTYSKHLTESEKLLLFISRKGKPIEEDSKVNYKCPPTPTNCKTLTQNFNNPEAFPFFAYLHNRGITMEQIQEHNISYVINGEVELLDGRKMTLINHLVFFTFNDKRKPLYWNTRSIDPNPYIKSFNAPSREGEYSKKNTLFNLNNANNSDRIVVTEGVFDAMTVGQSGVATFGKMITDQQVDELLQKTKDNNLPIYLYLDKDAWESMIESARKIKSKDSSRAVYFVASGSDQDANELGTEKVNELIDQAFPADAEGELKLSLISL